MNILHERYQKEIAPALFKTFNFKNVMQVPRIEKVVVNIGLGEAPDAGMTPSAPGSGFSASAGASVWCRARRPLSSRIARLTSRAQFKQIKILSVVLTASDPGRRLSTGL